MKADKVIEKAKEENRKKREMLEDVADWFHEREGELLERKEAIENISDDFKIGRDLANRVISGLVEDRVDPVIQEMDRDRKKVGIIEYWEGEKWYGYTHVDDVKGERERIVCAKCVDEVEKDSLVAYAEQGSGSASQNASREELEEIMRDHIDQDHRFKDISGVKTGASLKSGTTIGGNVAWHLGNDGRGTGMNADRLDGQESSDLADIGTEYVVATGLNVFKEVSAPDFSGEGLAFDSSDSIWHSDSSGSIYKLDKSGNEIDQFSVTSPSADTRGMGVDSSGCLWYLDYLNRGTFETDSHCAVKTDTAGSIVTSFISSVIDPSVTGLDVDSNDCIWVANTSPDEIIKYDQSGTQLDSFAAPSILAEASLGIDKNDSIWVSIPYTEVLKKFDQTGSIIDIISSPSEDPEGIAFDSNESIWNIDSGTDKIYNLGESARLYRK